MNDLFEIVTHSFLAVAASVCCPVLTEARYFEHALSALIQRSSLSMIFVSIAKLESGRDSATMAFVVVRGLPGKYSRGFGDNSRREGVIRRDWDPGLTHCKCHSSFVATFSRDYSCYAEAFETFSFLV
jgi:hypothetical protein